MPQTQLCKRACTTAPFPQTRDSVRLIGYVYEDRAKGGTWVAAPCTPFDEITSYMRSLEARLVTAPRSSSTTVLMPPRADASDVA